MKKYPGFLRSTLIFTLLLAACSYEHVKLPPFETNADELQVVGFDAVTRAILEPGQCVMCHGANGAAGVSLQNYETILQQPGLVIPGDAKRSLLFKVVENGRMPPRTGRMPAGNIEVLRRWIDEGANESGVGDANE